MSPFQPKSSRHAPRSRLWLSLLVLGALWLLPSAAWAQFAVATSQYDRTPSVERNDAKLNLTISKADCDADGYFELSASGATVGNTLSVRAGTCNSENYNDDTQCALLKTTQSVKEANFTFKILFKELILAKRQLVKRCTSANETQEGCTVATACTDLEAGATTDVTLTISLDSSSVPAANVGWDVAYDLAGPDGPSDVSLGLGEDQLKVSWTALNDGDIASYQFFCEPKPGGTTTQSFEPMGPATGGTAGMAGASSGGTAGTGGVAGSGAAGTGGAGGSSGGAAGSGGTLSAAGSSSTAGSAGTTAAAGSGGSAGSTSNCQASVLVPGEIPPSEYKCGETTNSIATSGTVKDLANGTEYTVGVAAVDDLGNVGTLSDLACATPEPVDDFYEVYRRAGGEGGNGYCSINQSSAPGMLGLVLVAMGALVWRRRRMK
ncbi:MAG: hypothetical protein H6718_27760 [Polyangiaceae bacterium]|nr:hypothetical protein [Myxococcales bacterium]MCB9589242.1 hypothetical protein [Polyangiaceae bacterium]